MTETREGGSPAADPFAEVRVIDSQLQHFSNYIDVIQVYKCRICSFCSPLEHVIASHMSEVHFPRRCFLCKQCLFVFEERSQLKSHLESAHGTRSINVCFGESGPFVNSSPPTWHVGVGRSSEDDEQLSRQSTEEQAESEPNNGRVTSSTGNLANLPDEGLERGNSTSSLSVPTEGEFLRRTPGAEGRQEQVLSRGSSCNPSTTDQELTAVSDPSLTPLVQQQSSSLENTSRQGSQESPERIQSETPKLHPSPKDSYIKTEPVSPVPSQIMCPKRRVKRSLLQASHSGESIDIDVETRSHNDHAPEKNLTVHPETIADTPKQDSPPELMGTRRPSIQGGRSGTGAGKGESVLRGLLRRQRTIEDMDADVQSDPHEGMSPPQEVSNMPRSMSLSETPRLSPINSTLPRQSSEPIARPIERHEESEEAKQTESESPELEETVRTETASRDILHEMETCNVARIDRRSDQGHRRSTDILRKTGSIDETSSGQPAPRGCRQRSYSLTEGDARLPPDVTSADFRPHQPADVNVEKEQPRFPMYRPQDHHPRMPYWPRGYPGLIHQPFAVDNDPRKMWHSSLSSFQSQGSVQSEPSVPSRQNSEHGKSLLPTQMSEDSFLGMRHPMGPRRKRNPAALSNQHSTDGVAPTWVGHNQFTEAGRAPMMGTPWHHFHRGMPPHMLIRQNADDKSASPSISSSTSHRHMSMYPGLERSHSGPGEMPPFERRRPPMLGHVGASSESSQELPPTEDITRQVHRAISGNSGLYPERAAISWSDQSSGNNTSMEGENGKDIDFKKRSRKSTFNIYREIPERKRKLDRDEEERIKSSYNPDGSFDYFSLTGWKAYKCELCKKRRFKTLSELEEHKRRKHALQHTHIGNASSSSSSGIGASMDDGSSSPQLTPQLSNG